MSIQVPFQPPRSIPCQIAFVGEAPSDEELEQKKPLVGPSGRQFNTVLRHAGIRRDDHMVTNVFSEKLPGNDVAAWCIKLKEARDRKLTDIPPIGKAGFLDAPYRWHLDRLQQELEQWQPRVIVPLGGTALWAFTGQTSITALRGTVVAATRVVPGAKLLPTFHPAVLFHSFKYFSVMVGDLEKAQAEASRGPGIDLAPRSLVLRPTLDDVVAWRERLLSSDLLSVDIETGWGQITCIGFAPNSTAALCIPFVDRSSPSRSYWDSAGTELAVWKMVREILESDVPKVGQNFGTYDAYWLLEKKHIAVRNLVHDTRLLHHTLYPELEKGLEFMGNSYANQGAWKYWSRQKEKRDD